MKLPDKDQIKEDIIKRLSFTQDLALLDYCSDEFGEEDERSYPLYNMVIRELTKDGIIYSRDEDSIWYSLEPKGEMINSAGGWIEYKNKLKQKEGEQEKIIVANNEKAFNDAKLSKLKLKTFWPLFLIALIGGLCGITSFF